MLSVVAGGGAIWQGIEARKTRLQMISTFQMEERPWLETGQAYLTAGRLLITLHNRGKTHAYDVNSSCLLFKFEGRKEVQSSDTIKTRFTQIDADRYNAVGASIPWNDGHNLVTEVTRFRCSIGYEDQFHKAYPPLQFCYEMTPGNGAIYFCDNQPPIAR